MKKFDSIIFDLDGTLWDTTEVELNTINEIIKRDCIFSTITLAELKSVMGYTSEEASEILFGKENKEVGIQLLKESSQKMMQYLKVYKNTLYDNVKKTIELLSRQYKLCIASNCQKGYIETFLETQDLKAFFIDYICNGETGLSKGNNIKILMERNNLISPIYIGDTQKDFEAIKFAQISFGFASYGFGEVSKYDYKLNNIKDLLILLN